MCIYICTYSLSLCIYIYIKSMFFLRLKTMNSLEYFTNTTYLPFQKAVGRSERSEESPKQYVMMCHLSCLLG